MRDLNHFGLQQSYDLSPNPKKGLEGHPEFDPPFERGVLSQSVNLPKGSTNATNAAGPFITYTNSLDSGSLHQPNNHMSNSNIMFESDQKDESRDNLILPNVRIGKNQQSRNQNKTTMNTIDASHEDI